MHLIRLLAIAAVACALLSRTASAAGMATGAYECWGNGEARMLMNFTVTGAGTYRGSDNSIGHFMLTGNTIDFTSGTLHGAMPEGFVSKYEIRKGIPTVSFVGRSGFEAQFCEHVK